MAVRRLPNNNLTWLQDGVQVTVSKEETERYSPAVATEDAQKQAKEENDRNRNHYMTELKQAQVSVDASRPIDGVPDKPPYLEVSDPHDDGTVVTPGVQTEGEWPEPGLPDLKKKTIYPSGGGAPVEEEIKIK